LKNKIQKHKCRLSRSGIYTITLLLLSATHHRQSLHFPDYQYSPHTTASSPGVYRGLNVVISAANGVFIYMGQLQLYPSRIEILFMQNGAHGVTKPMAGGFAMVANPFNYLVYTGFTNRFSNVVSAGKYQ
jgi:hypothetical protein